MKKLIIGFLITLLIISIAPQKPQAATFSNQDVTAYVGSGKTYHGTNPRQYYTVAVGPKTCGNALTLMWRLSPWTLVISLRQSVTP
jgi:hypothetical protein